MSASTLTGRRIKEEERRGGERESKHTN